jgi:hypothetical protein
MRAVKVAPADARQLRSAMRYGAPSSTTLAARDAIVDRATR